MYEPGRSLLVLASILAVGCGTSALRMGTSHTTDAAFTWPDAALTDGVTTRTPDASEDSTQGATDSTVTDAAPRDNLVKDVPAADIVLPDVAVIPDVALPEVLADVLSEDLFTIDLLLVDFASPTADVGLLAPDAMPTDVPILQSDQQDDAGLNALQLDSAPDAAEEVAQGDEVVDPTADIALDDPGGVDGAAFDELGDIVEVELVLDAPLVDVAPNDSTVFDDEDAGISAACTLDVAAFDGPLPDAAMLDGESEACKALGIVACSFGPGDLAGVWFEYRCFNAAGTQVIYEAVGASNDLPKSIPCSVLQMKVWLSKYANPCVKLVPATTMPPSVVTLALDLGKVPTEVCSNADGTQFQFTVGCSLHTYTTNVVKGAVGPPGLNGKEDPGVFSDGNAGFTRRNLTISPPSTGALKSGYPFLSCEDYSAKAQMSASGCWSVKVTATLTALVIEADDDWYFGCAGIPPSWLDVLAMLVESFTTCEAAYSWK